MKKNYPGDSVIIPTCNRVNLVLESVNIVLCQTYEKIECMIVDDNSDDCTQTVIKKIKDSRVRYINNDSNLGAIGARNVGIKYARYDYIAFNNSKDILAKDKLFKQMSVMLADRACKVVYCAYMRHIRDERYRVPDIRNMDLVQGDMYASLMDSNKIGTPKHVYNLG